MKQKIWIARLSYTVRYGSSKGGGKMCESESEWELFLGSYFGIYEKEAGRGY